MSWTAGTFTDIIPDYDTWHNYSMQWGVVDFDDAAQAAFDKFCFTVLSSHFRDWDVRYLDETAFLLKLGNVYRDRFQKWMAQKRIIDYVHQLTPEDLQVVSEALTNQAINPNTLPTNPKAPLSYITDQTYSMLTNNKLQAYLAAINSMPSLKIYDFIGRRNGEEASFVDLFTNAHIDEINIYEV